MKTKLFLIFTLLFTFIQPLEIHAQEFLSDEQIQETIQVQVNNYVSSLTKYSPNDAALALATHGATKFGKKLSVGSNNAITYMLVNSELVKQFLTSSLTKSTNILSNTNKSMHYIHGYVVWTDGDVLPHLHDCVEVGGNNLENLMISD